jgi:hypothetical protein
MYDVEAFKRMYPEWFPQTTAFDIILGVLFLSLLFIIPYLYVRFLEDRLISLVGERLIPFIKFRMRLKKLIDFVHHILEIQIFDSPRSRV